MNYLRVALASLVLGLMTVGSPELLAKNSKKPKLAAKAPPKKPTAEDLVKNFTFVGDFEQKDETRYNSGEIFWRYPVTLPKIRFELKLENSPEKLKEYYPITQGEGRAIEHLNQGRNLFLAGQYEDARQTWLSARARFGKNYSYHRRNDYFIASAFLYKSFDRLLREKMNWNAEGLRQDFVNGNAFLSAAFDKKKDIADELLDKVAPNAYYNQAVILYNYDRWAGVVGAANLGLDYLRKTGRTEYRRDFHRLLAETAIRSQDYLEAVRAIDLTLRQDIDPPSSGALFARVGDIYFALNNFELAEEVYEAANVVDAEYRQIKPSQFVLRGESLFWLGRFEEARKNFQYALSSQSLPRAQEILDDSMQALSSLRIADSYLAEKNLEKAKIAYFSHIQEFRGHPTEVFAKLRLACLELPFYDGKNINHARELLEELKDQADKLPDVAQEMAWTCEMASYAQHERTPAMVERVRTYANMFPDSELLKSLVEPVRQVQSTAIDPYFASGDNYGAVTFYEKTKDTLYPKVSDELARKLFVAYVDIHKTERSSAFIKAYENSELDAEGKLRLLVAYAELAELNKTKERKKWLEKFQKLVNEFEEEGRYYPRDEKTLLSLERIRDTGAKNIAMNWVLAQSLIWAKDDISVACDKVQPYLEEMKRAGTLKSSLAKQADKFLDTNMKELFRFETSCAYSLMGFEISSSPAASSELVERFMGRSFLPLDERSAPLFWNLSEKAKNQKNLESARKVWNYLVSKGNPKLSEVRFAKARLDGSKTELEGLWNK